MTNAMVFDETIMTTAEKPKGDDDFDVVDLQLISREYQENEVEFWVGNKFLFMISVDKLVALSDRVKEIWG